MTDARTVNPGQPVTYHGASATPTEPTGLHALRCALTAIPDTACVNPPRWLADLVTAAELITGVRRETAAERTERVAPFVSRHVYEPAGPGGAWCGRYGKDARVGLHLPEVAR